MPSLTRRTAMAAALGVAACAASKAPLPMKQPGSYRFQSFDGRSIAYRIIGVGRPVLMIHGFTADAELNWIGPGLADKVAATGAQVILPDLRGHGGSKQGADPFAYPADALARDQEALIAHLGLPHYDLAGYSLGARTAVRMMARGAKPDRVLLGGMGDTGITDVPARQAYMRALIARDPAAPPRAVAYMDRIIAERGLSREEMLLVLAQQLSTPPEALAAMTAPILVLAGDRDADNGSAEGLAALLPNARALRAYGDHLSVIADPAFARAVVEFLS